LNNRLRAGREDTFMKFDKINMIYGLIATIGVTIFGKYWFLFAGFLILNVVDYITGYCKAKLYNKNVSSAIGAKGICKKVWYWLVIGLAFFISDCFVTMGEIIGIQLNFVLWFGWFTLATYLINEIRSILENLVEMNVKVPKFLIAGLDITQKLLDTKTDSK
jgi:toxin secretion/phage lysis holin